MPDRLSDAETELKLLRAQVGRLITENLALRQQLDQLTRQKSEMPVKAIAEAALRSMVAAEETMRRTVPDGRRYTIPTLDASLRGIVVAQEGAIGLRVASPEQSLPASMLGTVRVTVAQVPGAIQPVPADVAAPAAGLVNALERAQRMFAGWAGRGATAAGDVLTAVTQLLGTGPDWEVKDLKAGLESMIDAATRLAESVTGRVPKRAVDACLETTRELRAIGRSSDAAPPSSSYLERLAAGVDRLVEAYASLAPR